MAMSSPRWPRSGPANSSISERISVFEQKRVQVCSTSTPTPTSPLSTAVRTSCRTVTTSSKQFSAIKSQFDSPPPPSSKAPTSLRQQPQSSPEHHQLQKTTSTTGGSSSSNTTTTTTTSPPSTPSANTTHHTAPTATEVTTAPVAATPQPKQVKAKPTAGSTTPSTAKPSSMKKSSPISLSDIKRNSVSHGTTKTPDRRRVDAPTTAKNAELPVKKNPVSPRSSIGATSSKPVSPPPAKGSATKVVSPEKPGLVRKESVRKSGPGASATTAPKAASKSGKDLKKLSLTSTSSVESSSSRRSPSPPASPTTSPPASPIVSSPLVSEPIFMRPFSVPDETNESTTVPELSMTLSIDLDAEDDSSSVEDEPAEQTIFMKGPALPAVPTLTLTLEDVSDNRTVHILELDECHKSATTDMNLKNSLSSAGDVANNGSVRSTYWATQALRNDNALKINQAMKLDLDFKEEKINGLGKELEELQSGGATEEEVASLKKAKHDLEMRLREQEEEIDDMAGQVQMLEQAKTKLEMSMAALKKEHRRELSIKDEELEDARAASQKKIKILEQQLENEHEERINFVREKHELETKIMTLQEMASRSVYEDQVGKLKKDLKRTKALLKDAQLMAERSSTDSSSKVVLRQLKNQLEDAEFARTAAVKARQNLELDLADVQQQLDDVLRSKADLDERLARVNREKADFSTSLEDTEEELQEIMKKYKASVAQLSVDQITMQEQGNRIADLEEERNKLKENIAELNQKIESLEGENVTNAHQNRLEFKIKELESRLELEQTTRGRMESQMGRLKEAIEKLNAECESARLKEQSSQEQVRKLQRQLRDLREDFASVQQKETEVNSKKNELEKLLELAEAETVTAKNDLKLAMKRIDDLQAAINGDLDSDESDSDHSDSDSDHSDMSSFLHHNRIRTVVSEVSRASSSLTPQREVRASIGRHLPAMPEEPECNSSVTFRRRSSFSMDPVDEVDQEEGSGTLDHDDDDDESVA